jgi:TolB-like protein/Flp pilus assembly protein TadD
VLREVLGHYRITSQLGAGGMGEVYRAHDERLDRDVAVKVLPGATLADDAARKRFRREALALSKLNHPAIATIFDFDTQDGVDFLVMELVAGGPVTATQPLAEKDVLRLGLQLADGLAAAHAAGIVHCDLKPGNLRLTGDGRLKILDFGLARLLLPAMSDRASTMSAPLAAGTLAYMAPEQVRGDVDARVDIYAAGAVLYEAATGAPLFPDASGLALLDAIVHRPIVPPRNLNPRLSPALEHIIVKALDKDPERRYQSARELSVDLARLESGETTIAVHRPIATRWKAASIATAILATVVAGLMLADVRSWWRGGAAPAAITSLVVLPLANLSGDPEQDYFADGMTEALITDLGRLGALRVISRTSAMQYKGSSKSLPEIARALRVEAVLEGTVLRVGSRVRITAQLIHASSERHLWADAYEREIGDVLTLQREVAHAVATQIRATAATQDVPAAARATVPAAYEAFLKGQHHLNKRTAADIRKSIDYFHAAIAGDAAMAPAYAALADAYSLLGYGGYSVLDPREAMPRAKEAAQKALALDNRSAEAHTMLGTIAANYDWNRNAAEQLYTRAIELNPSYARARQLYAWHLASIGQPERARREIETARQLDPLSLIINHNVGWMAWYAHDFDRAIATYRQTLDLDAGFVSALGSLGQALVLQRRFAEGIASLDKGLALGARPTVLVGSLGYARAVSGDRSGATAVLGELVERSKSRYVPAYWIAVVHAGLGDRDRAFEWLERAYHERQGILVPLNVDPFFDGIRDDARFAELVRRIGYVP